MSKYDLQAIKAQNSIVDIAREFGYEVEGNAMRCFHPYNHKNMDEHPSLKLDPKSNSFKCFVCPNLKGDVIDFVCQSRNLRMYDAIRYLADRVGLSPISNDSHKNRKESTTEDTPPNQNQDKSNIQIPYDEAKETNEEFYDIYTFFLDHCSEPPAEAISWLKNRGISKGTVERQQIRYIRKRRELEENLRSQFEFERLVSSGLLNNNGNLLFSTHRLIWTYFRNNKPIYFQGRTLDGMIKPKELCLAQPIPVPYNVDVLNSKPGNAFICEGVIDTLTLIEHGLPAVGIVGAAGFKGQWLPLFKGFHVKVALDADIAGQARAIELVHRFRSAGIDAEKIYLPADYDVNRLFGIYRQFGGNGRLLK